MRIRYGSLPADTFGEVTKSVMHRRDGRVYFIGLGGIVLAWRRGGFL